jgi:predicted ArsR family transcriptional regulator
LQERNTFVKSELIISAAALRVVKLLVGRRPQAISELIKATGVTRTAVTEQLNELVAAGLVEKEVEKLPGRGRPRHLYRATDAAMRLLFPTGQRMLVPAIWEALGQIGGDKLLRNVVARVSRILAEHYSRRITASKPTERLQQLIDLLAEEGGLVEAATEDGRMVMLKRSCPFISMLDENRNICTVDEEMISAIVGHRVKRLACRHEGAPCCTFTLVD